MTNVFLHLFNMSITASWLALAVVLLRFCLKKAPKAITVVLWALVGVRLLCPFSVESVFSLIPSAETVPTDILYTQTPTIQSGIPAVNTIVNPILSETLTPSATDSVNPMQVVTSIACTVWLIGIAVMLGYTAFSYLRLHLQVREAAPMEQNVYLCDRIASPFILGIIKPRIYLPSEMNQADVPYVLAHESAHLKRRDHLWKPLGFLLLTVYWFNPVLWVAYVLLCRDIELACDEKVLATLGTDIKKPYSDALINCSAPRKLITACPLAFGESGVASRVKSVLHYKKPAFWVILIAVIASVVIAVCFLTDPPTTDDPSPLNYRNAIEFVETQQEIMAIHCPVTEKDEDGSILVGVASGLRLSQFLTEASWKEFVPPMNDLVSPGSVEFILGTDYRITVYRKQDGSLFSYAKVRYGEDLRYYRIGKDDYDKAVSLLHRPDNDTEAVPDPRELIEQLPSATRQEIERAWKAKYGSFQWWNGTMFTGSVRCYGTYGECVVLFEATQLPLFSKVTVAGYEFARPTSFRLAVFYGNQLIDLSDAYKDGLLTEEQIAQIVSIHQKSQFYVDQNQHAIPPAQQESFVLLEPPSEAVVKEINSALQEKFRITREPKWFNGDKGKCVRYYGTYGDCVVIFTSDYDPMFDEGRIIGAGDYVFYHGRQFSIEVFHNGELIFLQDAYENGLLSEEQIAEIAVYHANFHQYRNQENYAERINSIFIIG